MTRSSRPDWSSTLADIRHFNADCREGGPQALEAFSELTSRLFCRTVGDRRRGAVHLERLAGRRGHGTVAGGRGSGQKTIAVTDGRHLQFVVALDRTTRGRWPSAGQLVRAPIPG